jgi:hypothetical protein
MQSFTLRKDATIRGIPSWFMDRAIFSCIGLECVTIFGITHDHKVMKIDFGDTFAVDDDKNLYRNGERF